MTLESTRSQPKSCERLLQERQQHLDCTWINWDVLHLEIKWGICNVKDALQFGSKWLAAAAGGRTWWGEKAMVRFAEGKRVERGHTTHNFQDNYWHQSILGPKLANNHGQ